MINRGIPIDGVGMQMHVRPDWGLTRSGIAAVIKDYGDIGLEVHITELDVELCARTSAGEATVCDPNDSTAKAVQAQLYEDILAACYIDNPGVCTAILTWGYTDAISWLNRKGGAFYPLLFDENYEKKDTYWSMYNLLESTASSCTPRLEGATNILISLSAIIFVLSNLW